MMSRGVRHRMICTLAYFTLILYISQADGNPFLNFFIQSVIEAPAFFLGTYLGESILILIVSHAIDMTNNNWLKCLFKIGLCKVYFHFDFHFVHSQYIGSTMDQLHLIHYGCSILHFNYFAH